MTRKKAKKRATGAGFDRRQRQPSMGDMMSMLQNLQGEVRRLKGEGSTEEVTPHPKQVLSPEEIDLAEKQSQADAIAAFARENFLRYGTYLPPRDVELAMRKTKWCPHCETEKSVKDFGFKTRHDGVLDYQSWCSECRGSKAAHPTRYGHKR